jgi:hypothetical protein
LIPTIIINKIKVNLQYQRGKATVKKVIDPKILIASNLKFNKLPFNKAQNQTRLSSSNITKKHLKQNIKHYHYATQDQPKAIAKEKEN